MDYVIGCDVGTQSTKAVLVSLEGALAGQASANYTVDYPQPLWAEQPVERWLEALTQNAWDTGAGWGLILTYAAYMSDRGTAVKNAVLTGVANNTATARQILTNSVVDDVYMPRLEDNDPRDSGQYGVALRWFVPELNDTEFGFYAMNYHSRNPVFSTIRTTTPDFVSFIPGAPNARYFIEYPEDIRLYGLSFQTNVGGTALSGEISYRPNMPMQINSTDLSFAALGLPFNPVFESGHAQNVAGADIHGYERKPFTQAQVTAVQFIDRVLGASRLTLLGEVGWNHIGGIKDDPSELRFGRDPIYGAGEFSAPGVCAAFNAANPDECQGDGFYTDTSWGYRLRASADYSNVFAGVNLTPSVAWSHDVDGYGPNFNEGSKAISIALNADYQNTYNASLSYTDFFGGEYNTITDRDFVALSFGVNF